MSIPSTLLLVFYSSLIHQQNRDSMYFQEVAQGQQNPTGMASVGALLSERSPKAARVATGLPRYNDTCDAAHPCCTTLHGVLHNSWLAAGSASIPPPDSRFFSTLSHYSPQAFQRARGLPEPLIQLASDPSEFLCTNHIFSRLAVAVAHIGASPYSIISYLFPPPTLIPERKYCKECGSDPDPSTSERIPLYCTNSIHVVVSVL